MTTYQDRIETVYLNEAETYTKIIKYMNGTIHRINDRGYNEYTTYANTTERTLSIDGLY